MTVSGAKRAELKEVILHAAPGAGFISALSAMLRRKLLTWRRGPRERRRGGAQTAAAVVPPRPTRADHVVAGSEARRQASGLDDVVVGPVLDAT